MKDPYDVENPMVEDHNELYSESYFYDSYNNYIKFGDDEPDWDMMPGGHDDYE